jgi:hypothetical protein
MLLILNGAWGQSGLNRHTVWATDILPWDSEDALRLKRAKIHTAGLSGTDLSDIDGGLRFWRENRQPEKAESVELPADPCERAAAVWLMRGQGLEPCIHEADGLNTVILALINQTFQESRASNQTESEVFTYTYSKEAEEYTGDPDDFCYVRFTKHVLNFVPGEVIATSKAVGAKWERHAQAKVIGHDEAQAYADRQKRLASGWMEGLNFSRITTATNSRALLGSTPTTQAAEAA